MSGQLINALVAIAAGLVVGFVLFVPFVAIAYRRRGRLGFGRLLVWAGALIYFWAIWSYTLLPLPERDRVRCAGVELDPRALLRDLRGALEHGTGFLTDPAFLQIALNVVLFVPLGFFVRVLGGRGILIALMSGLGLSLLIETTQLTGVWGLYPCAYRVFDVGDLITNTSGAVLGSVFALVVPREHRGLPVAADADLPRPVTRMRRLLAMLCDAIGFALTSAVLSVLITGIRLYLLADGTARADDRVAVLVGSLGAAAVWLLAVLATGRSPGDAAVRLQYRGRIPALLGRPLRWLAGIGGACAIGVVWEPYVALFTAVAVLLTLFTRRGRGLPWLVSGQELTDARDPDPQPIPITNR